MNCKDQSQRRNPMVAEGFVCVRPFQCAKLFNLKGSSDAKFTLQVV